MRKFRNFLVSLLICLVFTLLNFSLAFSDWYHDTFVIADFYPPRIRNVTLNSFEFNQEDYDRLKRFRDAHFNACIGFNIIGAQDYVHCYKSDSLSYSHLRYFLNYMEMIDGDFYVFVTHDDVFDIKMGSFQPANAPDILLDLYGPSRNQGYGFSMLLSDSHRDMIAGYNIGDEPYTYSMETGGAPPFPAQVEAIEDWFNVLRSGDPSKEVYINLLPTRDYGWLDGCDMNDLVCYELVGKKKLKEFVDIGFRILSYTNYPQIQSGGLREHFYLSYRVMAETVKENPGTVFWNAIRAVEYFPAGISPQQTTRLEDYRYRVNSGLIYGAKGVEWFLFDSYHDNCSHPSSFPEPLDAGWGPSALRSQAIYDNLVTINSELKNMGPFIMPLNWVTTIHSHTENNENVAVLSGPETGLKTITESTPILYELIPENSSEEKDWAIGIFEDEGSSDFYLMVFNKHRATSGSKHVTLKLKNCVFEKKFDKTNSVWEDIGAGDRSELTLTVGNAELELIKVKPCISPPSGQVHWWTLDEGSGTVAKDIIGGSDGTLMNSPVWTTGKVDQALSFDGVDDYVEVPYSSSLDIPPSAFSFFTFDAWVFFSKGGVTILDKNSGESDHDTNYRWIIGLGDHPDDTRLGIWNGGSQSSPDLVFANTNLFVNTWHHVAVVYDAYNLEVEFYVDGKYDGSGLWDLGNPNRAPLHIGKDFKDRFFEGAIDELTIYNRALTESEIQAIYNAGSAGKCKDAIPIWGDLNSDGCVDRADLSIILADIRGPEPHNPSHDLNGDGKVNIADARYLVRLFSNPRGAACE